MSYTLASHPEWTCEDLRTVLIDRVRDFLGKDWERLGALDVAQFYPENPEAGVAAMKGEDVGPVIQVIGFLRAQGDENSGRAFGFKIPWLLRWADVDKLIGQMQRAMWNAVRMMRREELHRRLGITDIATQDPAAAALLAAPAANDRPA
jgi:hypothetical protein